MRRGKLLIACLCAALLAVAAAVPAASAEANRLALTPPMGWNDWYSAFCGVSAQLVEQTAQTMASDGLRTAGYRYVNIDDCWMTPSRDSAGNLVADPTRFPSGIKPVADYLHSLGLRLGIYEDAGTATCAGLPGSYGHEAQDAATFASWGVDYVKYDRCNIPYGEFPGESPEQVQQTLYARMSAALKATGRPIVFSICNPDPGDDPWAWGAAVANLWRTTPDIADNFGSMLANFEGTVGLFRSARPGAWNDPDMLQIGNGGSTTLEYQTEFSLWAEMAAPLIASTNLATLSAADLAIYENRNVIAVDQDPLGKPGVPVRGAGGLWALSKQLRGGDHAVVLFNSTGAATRIATSARAVGLPGAPRYRLTNLWNRQSSESGGGIAAFVPAHGVAMFRITPLPSRDTETLAPHSVLSLSPHPGQIHFGELITVIVSFTNQGTSTINRLTLGFRAPKGWHGRTSRNYRAALRPGRTFRVAVLALAPSVGPPAATAALTATASYTSTAGRRVIGATFGEQLLAPTAATLPTAK
ncbi:MAG: glycoside hydrolase family 27 protein [Solirubrobacterales bacterium]|nr:glycoside hydrolase family 27 protein [Solirubrobacterales bacterium]